jgi:DNA primase large subunit
MWLMKTRAQKAAEQKRFRDRRNTLARLVRGEPQEIAQKLVGHFGEDVAREISQALAERLSNLTTALRSVSVT